MRQPAARQQPQSQSAAPDPLTATGAAWEAEAEQTPPAPDELGGLFGAFAAQAGAAGGSGERKVSHHKGGSKAQRVRDTLVTYYALAGMGVARFDQFDGQLIMARAEGMADAWMAAGKANPQIMRVLELITVAGPYTALFMVHAEVALAIMQRHGASPFSLLVKRPAPADGAAPAPKQKRTDTRADGASSAAPLPYQPVGPMAPTDAAPMPLPAYAADELVVIPEEGIPADVDVALRQMARQSGRPYNELRQEALLELAQLRMQHNGHIQHPGALGAPVARE